MIEEQKWKKPGNRMNGASVWSHDGMLCTGETYAVKLTFALGTKVPRPRRRSRSTSRRGSP